MRLAVAVAVTLLVGLPLGYAGDLDRVEELENLTLQLRA